MIGLILLYYILNTLRAIWCDYVVAESFSVIFLLSPEYIFEGADSMFDIINLFSLCGFMVTIFNSDISWRKALYNCGQIHYSLH